MKNFNNPKFQIENPQKAKFIILRSSSFENVHKAIKNGKWTRFLYALYSSDF
jgi:hypothetical protein